MMFYTEDKFYTYPNKSVIEDILTREGPATMEDFTPFTGQAHLVREQFMNSVNDPAVTVNNIIRSGKDFLAEKARPNDDDVRDYDANDVEEYYKRLEDIEEKYVIKYATELIIGYKLNNNGLKKDRQQMSTITEGYFDDDADEFVPVTDVLMAEEDYSTSELVEAKEKLVYCLKVLHEGSILYEGSLLSFVIAREKFYRLGGVSYLKPSDACSLGVYGVDYRGDITYRFVITDNTNDRFRRLFAWVRGDNPGDRYYRVAKDLVRACGVLGIDIAKEDARWYSSDIIEKSVCLYLESTEEYLEGYGLGNRNVVGALSEEKVLKAARSISRKKQERQDVYSVIEDRAMQVREMLSRGGKEGWQESEKAVGDFLRFYNERIEPCETSLHNYDVTSGLLEHDGWGVFVIAVGSVMPDEYALLSVAGKIIKYEIGEVKYIDTYAFMRAYEGGVRLGWHTCI